MVITFDFDDTLLWTAVERDADGEYLDHGPIGQNPHVFPRLEAALDSGAEVHLVTSRRSETRPEVMHWLKRWGVLDRLAGVHFTEGQLKHDTLERLGSEQHFDDDPEELAHLPERCRGVRAPLHDSWTTRLDERRYIASSRSDELRSLRVMSREEQLLREAVRAMLQEVDPETERLSGVSGVPKQDIWADTATKVGVASDILGAVLNFIPTSHPAVTLSNVGADVVSVIASGYLLHDEKSRHDLAMNAVEMLRAENDFYHDATGSYGHSVETLNKFELYYDARALCAAVQFLLGLVAAVPSVMQALGYSSPLSMSSAVELGLKLAKAAVAALTAADSAGRIDLAQGVTNALDTIGDLWDTVSKSPKYAAVVDKYAGEVLALFKDPKFRAAIAAGLLLDPATQGVGRTTLLAVDVIEKTLPKLQTA
jgi:hypothetical protein